MTGNDLRSRLLEALRQARGPSEADRVGREVEEEARRLSVTRDAAALLLLHRAGAATRSLAGEVEKAQMSKGNASASDSIDERPRDDET